MAQKNIPDFIPGFRLDSGGALSDLIATNDAFLSGVLKGANMNVTTDQAIPLSLPPVSAGGSGKYYVQQIMAANPSISLTTAVGGIYTGPGKTGVQIVSAAQAYAALTQGLVNVAGSLLLLTIALPTAFFTAPQLYLALSTPQGAAATADFYVTVGQLP